MPKNIEPMFKNGQTKSSENDIDDFFWSDFLQNSLKKICSVFRVYKCAKQTR